MKYAFFIKKAFLRNTIYRMDYILGLVNSFLQIYISCEIWKALYSSNPGSNKVAYGVVVTNFIINLSLANAYTIDDLMVQKKMWDGTIIFELLKPINFRLFLLADTVGNVLFKVIFNFAPSLIVMMFVYRDFFIFCSSFLTFSLFILSVILGFIVLWEISSIIQMLCFWFLNVWSISTIKNVFVNVLSGAMLPIWFFPDFLEKIVELTPFQAIYVIPIKVYLQQLSGIEMVRGMFIQGIWIVIFSLCGNFLWYQGKKKLVIQGG